MLSCATNHQRVRAATKALLMPLLAGIYVLSAEEVRPLVLAALGMGWLGDLFLIDPNRIALRMMGVGSFVIGHGFYIAAMLVCFAPQTEAWVWVLVSCVALAAAAAQYVWVRPVMPKEMCIPGAGYFLALAAVNALAAVICLGGGSVMLLLGFLLFLASDTVLCRQFFTVGHPAPKHDVAVMTTYILAQSCIIFAFVA